MSSRNILAFAAAFVLAPLAFVLCFAPPAHAADNLQSVLSRLDQAAANFHTTTADFTFDTETVEPIADTDIQKGTVYYERQGSAFKMAAHINQSNGNPIVRAYADIDGHLSFYDQPTNQVTRISGASKFEGYISLGFGASGRDLAGKWTISDLGPEIIDGVKTEKLELIARDPAVRKIFTKVTIWVDLDRAVSLRQRFDEGASVYRICTYSHFRINQSLPRDAFSYKTNSSTTYVNR
jgi:outer membrane lipoprotein-sorting protein